MLLDTEVGCGAHPDGGLNVLSEEPCPHGHGDDGKGSEEGGARRRGGGQPHGLRQVRQPGQGAQLHARSQHLRLAQHPDEERREDCRRETCKGANILTFAVGESERAKGKVGQYENVL
eukprot:1896285-Pyramimonas_sp.AAC.1